jgi:hypothetical protein
MKRNIALLGLAGLVGCFLPLVPGLSLFDLRHFAEGWSAWLVMAAFATPAYVGATTKNDVVAGLAGLVSFGYLAIKFGTGTFHLIFHAASGGILIGVAIIAGLCASVAALAVQTKR